MHLLAESKGKTGLLHSLCKVLSLDGEITNGHGVLGDEALHRARAITDLEGRAVGLVRAGGAAVVLGVEEASNGCAALAGDPKIRRTVVQHMVSKGFDGQTCDDVFTPCQG